MGWYSPRSWTIDSCAHLPWSKCGESNFFLPTSHAVLGLNLTIVACANFCAPEVALLVMTEVSLSSLSHLQPLIPANAELLEEYPTVTLWYGIEGSEPRPACEICKSAQTVLNFAESISIERRTDTGLPLRYSIKHLLGTLLGQHNLAWSSTHVTSSCRFGHLWVSMNCKLMSGVQSYQ